MAETKKPEAKHVGTLDQFLERAVKDPPGTWKLIAMGRGGRVTWQDPDYVAPAEPKK